MAAVSRWQLDENTGTTVSDSVGANTGTLSDSSGWSTSYAPLSFANVSCLAAAGTKYVSLANGASLDASSSFSVSLWVRWNTVPTTRSCAFGMGTENNCFFLSLGSSYEGDGKVGFDVGNTAVLGQACKSAATIVPGRWYHVVAVLRSGSADLYVDGNYESTVTYDPLTVPATANTFPWYIGCEDYYGTQGFFIDGYVDEVRIFSHELNGTEITDLSARSYPTVSLSASTTSIAENGGTAEVSALLSSVYDLDVTVALSLGGTAINGTDYSASSTSILIAVGQTSGSITITAIDDSSYEGGETVIVDISSVTNGTENGTQQVTLTITDDDSSPVVSIPAIQAVYQRMRAG